MHEYEDPLFALYRASNDQEYELNKKAEREISAARREANEHMRDLLDECDGNVEDAAWMAWDRYIYPVATQYCTRGATDTASREAILEGLVFPTWSGTAAANDSERGEEESVAKTVSKTRPLDDMETMDTNADGATGCHERPECSGQASLSASLSTPGATSSGAMTELEQKDSSPAPGAAHVGQPDSASSPPSPFPPPSSPVSRASSLLDVAGCQSRMPQKNENKANVPPRRQFSARQLSASILTPSHNLHSCHRNVDAAPVEAPMETEWEAERRMETEWEAEAEAEGEGEGEAAAAAAAAAAAEAGEQGNSSETVVPAGVGVEASEPPSPLAAATGAHPGAVVPQAEEERGAEEEGNINVCVVSNVAGRVKGVVARLFSLMGVAKRGNSKQTGRAKAGKGKVAQGPGVAAEGPRRSPRLQRTRVQARAVSMTRAMSRAVSLARSMSEARRAIPASAPTPARYGRFRASAKKSKNLKRGAVHVPVQKGSAISKTNSKPFGSKNNVSVKRSARRSLEQALSLAPAGPSVRPDPSEPLSSQPEGPSQRRRRTVGPGPSSIAQPAASLELSSAASLGPALALSGDSAGNLNSKKAGEVRTPCKQLRKARELLRMTTLAARVKGVTPKLRPISRTQARASSFKF